MALYDELSLKERFLISQPANFYTMYHLLENREIQELFKKIDGASFEEIENALGYTKRQPGSIEKFLRYLNSKNVLVLNISGFIPKRYHLNSKKLKELFRCSWLFICGKNHDWGDTNWDDTRYERTPLPGKIRELRRC